MSWSINVVGSVRMAAEEIDKQVKAIHCIEPEETVKNHVADAIAAALAGYPEDMVVSVVAFGSQSAVNGGAVNNLSIKIEPIYGFVK